MSESGRKSMPNVWEWWETFADVRQRSRVSLGIPGVVGRASWMSGSGQKFLPEV